MKPLKILYITSELRPLMVTGGLGDVAAALPRALRAQGHDVRIAMPCYRTIPAEARGEQYCMCVADLGAKTSHGAMRISHVPKTDIPLFLIEHEGYFGREYPYGTASYEYSDNPERFCFFSLATLHGVAQTNWRPDIVHCHDWHTAAVPALIKTRLSNTEAWRGMPTLYTIHNLAYQGRYKAHYLPYTGLAWDLFHPGCLEFHGDMNLMKGAIAFASKLNTVSPRYAREIQTPEYGEGLDGFLQTRKNSLTGILNGVDYDIWSPAKDPRIAENYSASDLTGKTACKKALQKVLGLPQRDVPLLGMVTRIHWQKGMDLVLGAMDGMVAEGVQLVVLGTGDPYFETRLVDAARRHPEHARVLIDFDLSLSHQIEAGCDFFLMPSRFEPCGLSQMYSMAYGTIPIVRETGGLADSVRPVTKSNLARGRATGILFKEISPAGVLEGVRQATALYRDPALFQKVQVAGMKEDFSWDKSSTAYVKLYQQAIKLP